jgi:hypothetical protein
MISHQKSSSYGLPVKANGVWAGYAAFLWVAVFIAFHIYWAYGGRLGFGDASQPLPPAPTNGVAWIYACVVYALFIGGTLVPLALVQAWGRVLPGWFLLSACWFGSAILTLRALASYVDDLIRLTGLLPNGITGLTYEQIFGTNHVTAYMLWSSAAIDAYFLLGGILYGLAAWHNRHQFRKKIIKEEQ